VVLSKAVGGASTQSIATELELVNVGSGSVDLMGYTIRYWLTIDGAGVALIGTCTNGLCNSGTVKTAAVLPARARADYFVEYAFTSWLVLPGKSQVLTFEAHRSDWAKMDQSNDYSWPVGIAVGAEVPMVTIYRAGVLVAGVEP
jgi:hypothetical protein